MEGVGVPGGVTVGLDVPRVGVVEGVGETVTVQEEGSEEEHEMVAAVMPKTSVPSALNFA